MSIIKEMDPDQIVDQLIKDYDHTLMPVPDIEHEPQLLISKVRKHYMEYIIKLLAVNYETNQKLLNKNIYLPSAIWRCAKNIETAAAQTCMVIQLYRQNIMTMVKELKNDTKKGKLNRNLYECLHTPPKNDKKLQTTINLSEECNCECRCKKKKRRKISASPDLISRSGILEQNSCSFQDSKDMQAHSEKACNKIPVIINSQVEQPQLYDKKNTKDEIAASVSHSLNLPKPVRMSVELQESDDLMMQLEKLFQGVPNDDDLFDGALCDTVDCFGNEETLNKSNNGSNNFKTTAEKIDNSVIKNHSIQIKSLDERLASLAGILANSTENNVSQIIADFPKTKKPGSSKWLCEEYFLKTRFFEFLDEIGDCDRKKLARIKGVLLELFGEDSDDEGMVSPLEETPEFVISCKERIAPWVVKLLTPYYTKGCIRGKTLFKSLAKHLIRLIYQCSRYPHEYEVRSFVTDFLENHKMIRCEADFKEFRIENI